MTRGPPTPSRCGVLDTPQRRERAGRRLVELVAYENHRIATGFAAPVEVGADTHAFTGPCRPARES